MKMLCYSFTSLDAQVVKIRCVSYPDEETKAAGGIVIDVPFSIFPNI